MKIIFILLLLAALSQAQTTGNCNDVKINVSAQNKITQPGINTLTACQNACLQSSTCTYGIDWNTVFNTCSFSTTINTVTETGVNHYNCFNDTIFESFTNCLDYCKQSTCLTSNKCQVVAEEYFECCYIQGDSYACGANDYNVTRNGIITDDSCSKQTCLPVGICKDYMTTTFTCQCLPGYTGNDCESEIIHCLSYPCGDGSECISLTNDYECKCGPGFTQTDSKTCTDINECLINPCSNNGSCINQVNRYKCICPDGFIGINCTIKQTSQIEKKQQQIKVNKILKKEFSVSGGTILTMEGTFLMDAEFNCLGAYLISNEPALYAYISSKSRNNNTHLHFIMPRVEEKSENKYIKKKMNILLDYSWYNHTVNDNIFVNYIGNPNITNITPQKPLITGGVSIYVYGTNMSGVIPEMTYFCNASDYTFSQYETLTSICTVVNDTYFTCPFEGFNNFANQLKDENNTNLHFTIVMGFKMGNFPGFNNITKANPRLAKTFSLTLQKAAMAPFIDEEKIFVPLETLKIQGENVNIGPQKEDYSISIGQAECQVTDISSNEIQCIPPQEKPTTNNNNKLCPKADTFAVEVNLANEDSKKSLGTAYCLRYQFILPPLIILAIVVGCLLLIIPIIIFIICKCSKKRQNPSRNNRENDVIIANLNEGDLDSNIPNQANSVQTGFYDNSNGGFVNEEYSNSRDAAVNSREWEYNKIQRTNDFNKNPQKRITYTRPTYND